MCSVGILFRAPHYSTIVLSILGPFEHCLSALEVVFITTKRKRRQRRRVHSSLIVGMSQNDAPYSVRVKISGASIVIIHLHRDATS